MAVDEIVVESAPDMAACWPKTWPTARAADNWRQRCTDTQIPIEKLLHRDLSVCGPQDRRPIAFRYQHLGERQKWRQGYADPDIVPDPRAWLEARLGALAGFEIIDRG